MPDTNVPDDVTEDLEQTASGTINNTDGPGVAVYVSSDGLTSVVIYMGFEMDGYTLYQDISSVYPNLTAQFSLPPIIFCEHEAVDFDPLKDKLITIKVNGCYLSSICHKNTLQIAEEPQKLG